MSAPTAEAAAAPVLELDGITVRFGGIHALGDVSLSLTPGRVYGLIGPNGAGKTTLFDVISGLCIPNRGRVRLRGKDITRLAPALRARQGLHRTFQRVQTFGWLSAEDNLLASLEWRGGGGGMLADLVALPARRRAESLRRERVEHVLELCGLVAHRSTPAGSLPIGLARMVELGRAVVDPPAVLLLDEPTSGLEAAEIRRLAACIETVVTETGCVVLLVEHDMSFVMDHCDPVVVLERGQVLFSGTPSQVRANRAVQIAYLGELHDS